jgi:hypothetical protein
MQVRQQYVNANSVVWVSFPAEPVCGKSRPGISMLTDFWIKAQYSFG